MTLYHARPPPPVRNVPFAGGLHGGVPCYKSMKLFTKFNLVLIVIFGAGGLIIAQLAYSFLTKNAREQVL